MKLELVDRKEVDLPFVKLTLTEAELYAFHTLVGGMSQKQIEKFVSHEQYKLIYGMFSPVYDLLYGEVE